MPGWQIFLDGLDIVKIDTKQKGGEELKTV